MVSATHVARPAPPTTVATTTSSSSSPSTSTTSTTARPTTIAPSPTTTKPVVTGPQARTVYRVATSDPVVFVTIDDGFTRDPKLIEFVRAQHWPVSAFIIGSVARQAPAYFRQLRAAGATIEDHTQNHPDLRKLPADAQRAEICAPRQAYGSLIGATPALLRPPYGNFDATTRHAATQCGISTMVLWNATMQDGKLQIVGRNTFHAGDIVLLHFVPSLLHDLQTLSAMFASAHLRVARLEDYIA